MERKLRYTRLIAKDKIAITHSQSRSLISTVLETAEELQKRNTKFFNNSMDTQTSSKPMTSSEATEDYKFHATSLVTITIHLRAIVKDLILRTQPVI